MPLALALITVGAWFLYSGLKGQSLVDVLAGKGGDKKLDPAGGQVLPVSSGGPYDTDATYREGFSTVGGDVSTSGGARAIVDGAFQIAKATSPSVTVVSDYRPGSTTSSGNRSDHASNDANQAARDIGQPGVNALTGPPTADLDRAVVAIGNAFGRDYGNGSKRIVDTFNYKGYRVQIIWRTPEYGGHMGHIHVGARRA